MLACGTMATAQTIETRIYNLPGVYKGKFPCADCRGMNATLTLMCKQPCHTGVYIIKDRSLDDPDGNVITNRKGKWNVTVTNTITDDLLLVLDKDTEKASYYYVKRDGNLQPLDKRLQPMEVPYDITMRKQ